MEGQTVIQPKYSKGEVQFKWDDTLHTACPAVIQSGNERAVQRYKMSRFIKRGCANLVWETR